ncbi:hypothetical protein BJ875DRAFT_223951 [Amylocarpus encephaloides]|uniref:CID domain-containing protein n=1 Tax=Amylocarpus encephaloides TaxID=45428 RepID=A0A9P7Y8F6_9HELO|nr:hypothetical protein BJ875DRAFT_223951 [Amylocarpus encephaloides]
MASHQYAIAKASFSAGLLRPDPTSLSRDDIAHFHTLLNAVVSQCTPINVQKCKRWIIENVVQSTARCTALGKYLTALTRSFIGSSRTDGSPKREPSPKRKRLHLLYLLNDLLYHAKYRSNDASICSKVQPILVNLFGSAASFKARPKHQRKILNLLDIWEDKGYYSSEYIAKLREASKNGAEAGGFAQAEEVASVALDSASTTKLAKSAPFVMPAVHGDPSTPWYDLPAGNLMPVVEPNSTRPINPDMIKPMQFVAGPASEELVNAVKSLLQDVQVIYGTNVEKHEKASWDIDELGQPIILDEITGDILEGEGYYGWSRGFCEKMKRRKMGLDKPNQRGERKSRSRSRSSSLGRKRRHSDSDSSAAGNRRRRARSYTSSCSPSPVSERRPRNRSRSSSYSRSPRIPSNPRHTDSYPIDTQPPPPGPPFGLNQQPPPPPQFQHSFNHNFPPPPPPQSFNGSVPPPFPSWPPAPPPHMQYNQAPQYPPIPPPPPGNPPPMNFQQHGQGGFPPQGSYPPNEPGSWQGGPGFNYHGGGNWQGDGRGRGYSNHQNSGWGNNRGGQRGNYRGGRGW